MILVFPGSFDPVTNGHMDIFARAAAIADYLYVVAEENTQKKDEQKPLSRQDIKEIFNESFSEYQAREKEKKELLESLNQYGERKQNG